MLDSLGGPAPLAARRRNPARAHGIDARDSELTQDAATGRAPGPVFRDYP